LNNGGKPIVNNATSASIPKALDRLKKVGSGAPAS
jgi:hypothetical protein